MAEVLLGFLLHTYRERPGLIPPPLPSYSGVSILQMLSFLLNGSSILPNNPLHSGRCMIYGSPAERNGLQSQWMNQMNPRGKIPWSAACDSLFEMALLLLRSLCMVSPRFQRARIQTDTELFKKTSQNHGIFQHGSAPTDIFHPN